MLKLVTYPAAFGQLSASPFCVKAAYLLNASGMEWEREDTADPRKAPYGKLPVLETPEGRVPDSDNIRAYLEQKGAQFDRRLSELDKSNARAFIRMAEEHIYFHLVLDRWENDAVWPLVRDTYFREIPRPLRGIVTGRIRRNVLTGLKQQGLGRLSHKDRSSKLETDLEAITTRLWHGKFLFGDRPSAADASVGPMLAAGVAIPVQTPLRDLIAQNDVLMRYIEQVQKAMG